jgi:hypothetical protein
VQLDPITLYPKSLPGVNGAQIATVAIGIDLESLHRNLSYYAESSQLQFAAAIQSPGFSNEDRDIIKTVLMQNPEYRKPYSQQGLPYEKWRSQEPVVENSRIAFVAMATDLNHVRSDLRYYASADEGGYKEALHAGFPRDVSQTIEAIRMREDPFGSLR